MPKSNVELWNDKFEKNVARDASVTSDLALVGGGSSLSGGANYLQPERPIQQDKDLPL